MEPTVKTLLEQRLRQNLAQFIGQPLDEETKRKMAEAVVVALRPFNPDPINPETYRVRVEAVPSGDGLFCPLIRVSLVPREESGETIALTLDPFGLDQVSEPIDENHAED
jgi:hypothetical protein